jgi:hypothetical protein
VVDWMDVAGSNEMKENNKANNILVIMMMVLSYHHLFVVGSNGNERQWLMTK